MPAHPAKYGMSDLDAALQQSSVLALHCRGYDARGGDLDTKQVKAYGNNGCGPLHNNSKGFPCLHSCAEEYFATTVQCTSFAARLPKEKKTADGSAI